MSQPVPMRQIEIHRSCSTANHTGFIGAAACPRDGKVQSIGGWANILDTGWASRESEQERGWTRCIGGTRHRWRGSIESLGRLRDRSGPERYGGRTPARDGAVAGDRMCGSFSGKSFRPLNAARLGRPIFACFLCFFFFLFYLLLFKPDNCSGLKKVYFFLKMFICKNMFKCEKYSKSKKFKCENFQIFKNVQIF
jgi:hypothetical protein